MAKQKPPKAKELFWNPALGDNITGKFLHWEEVQPSRKFKPKKGETAKPSLAMRLLVTGGEKLVRLSFALIETFRPVKKSIKKGDRVSITYTEKKKLEGGHSVKNFDVTLNGKPLERPNPFGKPAAATTVDGYFDQEDQEGK